MKYGIRLPNPAEDMPVADIVAMARCAERCGYDSIWASDHVIMPEVVNTRYPHRADGQWFLPPETSFLDPLLTLARVVEVAPSCEFGTSIVVLPMRNPILFAKQVATLDYLTQGRFTLGIGVGWMEEEFNVIGAPFADRGKRTDEMIALMRSLWAQDSVQFQGQYWKLDGWTMRPRPIRNSIPLVWGGLSDVALKRVAKFGDGWMPTKITLDELGKLLPRLRMFCEKAGRDPDSVMICAKPGVVRIDAETHGQYRDLGCSQLILELPLKNAGISFCLEEIERVALDCGIKPRPMTR